MSPRGCHLNVEAAIRTRCSIRQIGLTPAARCTRLESLLSGRALNFAKHAPCP